MYEMYVYHISVHKVYCVGGGCKQTEEDNCKVTPSTQLSPAHLPLIPTSSSPKPAQFKEYTHLQFTFTFTINFSVRTVALNWF